MNYSDIKSLYINIGKYNYFICLGLNPITTQIIYFLSTFLYSDNIIFPMSDCTLTKNKLF